MIQKNVKRRYLSAPTQIFFNLTHRCNFRCKYCFIDANDNQEKGLSYKDIEKVFDQLQQLGVLLVILSGGEPLIRKDILQIIDLLKYYKFAVRLNTNGYFITGEIANQIKNSNIGWVNVSLDGPKHIHEEQCGVKNSFDRVISGIQRLKERGIRVGLELVLNSITAKYFYRTLKIAKDLRVDMLKIFPQSFAGRAEKLPREFFLSYDEWKDFYLELTKKKIEGSLVFNKITINPYDCNFCSWYLFYPFPPKKRKMLLKGAWDIDLDRPTDAPGGLRCNAAIKWCVITPNGDVYPCDQMLDIRFLKAGNVKKQSLKSIWEKSKVFNKLRNITRNDLIGPCRDCDNSYCTGYNLGEAYRATGNILGSNMDCIHALEISP